MITVNNNNKQKDTMLQGSNRYGNLPNRYRSIGKFRFRFGSVNYRSVSVITEPKPIYRTGWNNNDNIRKSALQPNKTAFCSLSKGVQRVKVYQNINFHKPGMYIHGVICVFYENTDFQKSFVRSTISACNFDTLAK